MTERTALILGASRGLGLGLAQEYLARGWSVIGTVRGDDTPLHKLAIPPGGTLRIERADITVASDITALRAGLAGQRLDLLFINAGVANGPADRIDAITDEAFIRVLATNTLGPLRALNALFDLVVPGGVAAVMSSGLGSVASNTSGGWEAYRASKAGLNTLLRSFAARHAGDARSFLAVAPGFVCTDMGGPAATLDVATSVRGIADMIAARQGKGGAAFVNYQNKDLAW